MPALEQMDRNQVAVLWAARGFTDKYGHQKLEEPVQIDVRWNTRRGFGQDPKGNRISLDASVVADQVILIGSKMWLGELADWYGTGSQFDDDEVHFVRTASIAKDIKGRVTRYEYGLTRNMDTTGG